MTRAEANRKRIFVPIDNAALVAAYKEDTSAVQRFAKQYGVTIRTIYNRLQELGIERRQRGAANTGTQVRENNPHWNGGRSICPAGYPTVAESGRHVKEHRKIMQEYMGRKLRSDEVVHHINGDKKDNRIENLLLTTPSEHMRIHARQRSALKLIEAKEKA